MYVCCLHSLNCYIVAEGALAPEGKDIAVREYVDSKYIVILFRILLPEKIGLQCDC